MAFVVPRDRRSNALIWPLSIWFIQCCELVPVIFDTWRTLNISTPAGKSITGDGCRVVAGIGERSIPCQILEINTKKGADFSAPFWMVGLRLGYQDISQLLLHW